MENFAFVIEDDEDLSAIFVKALEAAGFKVEAIRDGELAQKRLQEIETTPRVIVLDMHLPHVDGSALLKQIHANPIFGNTKIILATADNMLAKIYRDKANLVLVKPISFSQLRDLSAHLKL
jgi:CheY-like chemotaxis protein